LTGNPTQVSDGKELTAKEFGNNKNGILSVDSPEFKTVEECCWRQEKCSMLVKLLLYAVYPS